ncbi:hypothetical protein ACFLZB_02915 [Nanoarchaeota archaeon]
MKDIIITGFQPFGSARYNPTMDVVQYFDGKQYDYDKVKGLILPVAFEQAAKQLAEAIQGIDPYLVLSVGLAAGREDLNVEVKGVNIMNAQNPDANGRKPVNEIIDPQGPEEIPVILTGFQIGSVVEDLTTAGIGAIMSYDPGKYVCNDLMFRTLSYLAKNRSPIQFGFFHMPWLEQYRGQEDLGVDLEGKTTMPLDEITDALDLAVERTRM